MLETIRELLQQEPFTPFQVVMSSGDRFKIENPSLVVVGESQFTSYFPRSDGVVYLRLNQMVLLRVGELPA
jgi:hypothetical protein